MSRLTRASHLVVLLVVPLGAAQSAPDYHLIATLPDIVDGRMLASLTLDPVTHRLFAQSQFGVYGADLSATPAAWVQYDRKPALAIPPAEPDTVVDRSTMLA